MDDEWSQQIVDGLNLDFNSKIKFVQLSLPT
jgi:hypothetical protein